MARFLPVFYFCFLINTRNDLVKNEMTLKLYKADFSPPARAVMMVLDILKIPYEAIEINLKNQEHLTPEFLKKNPVHTIPVLEEGDLTLQDSHAMLMYIVDKYAKDDALYPKDIAERALVNQKLFFDTCFLYFRLKVIAHGAFYYGQKSITDKQRSDILEAYSFFEEYLSRSKFLAGDHVTIADLSALSYHSTIAHLIPVDPKKFPLIDAWTKYFDKQSYVQKYNASGALELAERMKTCFETNSI